MKPHQILLYPFAILYGLIAAIRNLLFDIHILPSKKFNIPVISIGNLSTGGTGKTPHVEYLTKLLHEKFKLAVLSRGYGRRSSVFKLVDENSLAAEVGDESLQIKRKFKEITVAVSGSRVKGINKILSIVPETDLILLDDAFQHRYVSPTINILLTEYSKLFLNDYVLPSGNLREFSSGASRADIIIVTKTPAVFSPLDRRFLIEKINPKPYQNIYFSYTCYGNLISLNNDQKSPFSNEFYFERNYHILLITGIANSTNLYYYISNQTKDVKHLGFSDHHKYTVKDVQQIKTVFDNITKSKKIILTTEKDAMRLKAPELQEIVQNLPIFYIPVEVKFHGEDETNYLNQLSNYVGKN
jgi:tetraacyldisaccharide 4'-kinase